MALSILDGNQSATTLSTILSSGQHITAHTVVSLGTQAITDIVNATSAGLTNSQLRASAVTIGGTVTANFTTGNSPINSIYAYITNAFDDSVIASDNPLPISGTVTIGSALPAGTNRIGVVTIGGGTVTIGAGTSQIGSVTVGNTVTISGTVTANPTGTQTIAGTVTANGLSIGSTVANVFPIGVDTQFSGVRSVTDLIGYRLPISLGDSNAVVSASLSDPLPSGTNRIGVVTVGNSITIGSLPAIAGTVTANNTNLNRLVQNGEFTDTFGVPIIYARVAGGALDYWKEVNQNSGLPVANQLNVGGDIVPFAISGTVTVGAGTAQIGSVTVGNSVTIGSIPAISGTVTANIGSVLGFNDIYLADADNDNKFSSSYPFPISGTVTANSSNGSLTTRFGSVTTANTAFATSAVTNTNRKYLLIQNITTAANVITVGIGFTPTTTQGIQLFAGAGLTFEGSYIPTGAINLLSSVTASCYTILEA